VSAGYPPQDLTCPDPAGCPIAVPDDLSGARIVDFPANTEMVRVYDSTWGFDEANPGFGDARFGPFDSVDGSRVPTMYLAQNQTGALLETVFHDAEPGYGEVYESTLRNHCLVSLSCPHALRVVDLRDPELARMGVGRDAVASSTAEHYPCTRRLARHFHSTGAAGILWHSRQAEFHRGAWRNVPASEVLVVFGDRIPLGRGDWTRLGPGAISLVQDTGRTLVDEVATELDVTVVTD